VKKACNTCRKRKALSEFHANRTTPDGRHNTCKACRSAADKARYQSQPLREKRYDQRLRRKYGLTTADYEVKLAEQQGSCAICGNPTSGSKLHVDHCHEENVIRGLLCATCNNWLGVLEQTDFVVNALAYLSRYGSNSLPALREAILSAARKSFPG